MNTPTRQIVYSFHAGEIAPTAYGRADLDRYNSALSLCQNFIVTQQGGLVRRMGSHHTNEVKNSANFTKLVRFEFSNVQAYMLEFGDLYIRFYKDGGIIESSPGVPVEVVTPYLSADLSNLVFTQSADYLYITHPSHAPRKLTRTSHAAWNLAVVDFVDGPYLDLNKDDTFTMTLSAVAIGTGVTMTANKAIFTANHIGALFRIEEAAASKNNAWETNVSYAQNARVVNDGRVYEKQDAGSATSGKRPPTHTIGTESDGTVNWTWLHNGYGIVKVTGFTDSMHVTVQVIKTCPNSATGGTLRWREGAWSNERGWPGVVTFYQERLVFACNAYRPQTFWMSCSSDYEKFSPTDRGTTVLDTNAISVTIASNTVSNIVWLTGAQDLVIGTLSGEWVARAASTSKAIAPDNIKVENQTSWGSSDMVPSIRVGSGSLFVQRGGRRVRELLYTYDVDNFQAREISILSEHLTQLGGGVVDCAYSQEPYSTWWGVRADGLLIGCTYVVEQKFIGWHRHVIGGTFQGGPAVVESVACIPAADGSHDQVWLIVKRTMNGQTKRYIEYLEKPFIPTGPQDNDGMWYIDTALQYDGVPTTAITGLGHLEGQTVDILADGSIHPRKTVTGGAITLDRPASKVIVGIHAPSKMTNLPLEAPARKGSSFGSVNKISKCIVQMRDSLGLKYGAGIDADRVLPFRKVGQLMDQRPDFNTGFEALEIESGYMRDGVITIEQEQPYPLNILSLSFEAAVYE